MRKLKLGFVSRLVFAYSLVLLVFLTVLFGAGYLYILQVNEQSARDSQEQLLEKISNQIEQCFDDMRHTAEMMQSDPKLVSTFAALA